MKNLNKNIQPINNNSLFANQDGSKKSKNINNFMNPIQPARNFSLLNNNDKNINNSKDNISSPYSHKINHGNVRNSPINKSSLVNQHESNKRFTE